MHGGKGISQYLSEENLSQEPYGRNNFRIADNPEVGSCPQAQAICVLRKLGCDLRFEVLGLSCGDQALENKGFHCLSFTRPLLQKIGSVLFGTVLWNVKSSP